MRREPKHAMLLAAAIASCVLLGTKLESAAILGELQAALDPTTLVLDSEPSASAPSSAFRGATPALRQ